MELPVYGIFFGLLSVFILSVSCVEDLCRHLDFKPASAFEGKRLVDHVIRTIEHVHGDFCGALCFMEHNCVSFNLEITSGSDAATKCELNNSTHQEHPDDLKPWNNYIYRGTKNPCGKLPCQRNATCQTGFTSKGYRCLCPPGFDGDHCENDTDECSTGNDCHVNADCTNTEGSYNCTCKEGYYGNGRNCTAGESCLAIKKIVGEQAVSGAYWLFQNGSKFLTYCDMESSGRVWTLIARFSNADGKNWMEDSGEWWYDNMVAVRETSDPSINSDMISPAFWLFSGNELKITRSDDPQHTTLLQTTGDCLVGQTFRSKITSYGDFRNGTSWNGGADRCRGDCNVTYGGQYETTNGFAQAKCNGEIQSANKIGFWCVVGWSGSVMMIGGGGQSCDRADHGIGVTSSKAASLIAGAGRRDHDYGNEGFNLPDDAYALNLWIR